MSEDNDNVNGSEEANLNGSEEAKASENQSTEEDTFVDRRDGGTAGDVFAERRVSDQGPPPGVADRRALNQRLFDRRAQGSTTGELLVEVGRFAAENMAFRQKENKAAARRARKHLSMIMKLAKQRRAEISAEVKAMSPKGGPDLDDDDDGDE